MRTKPENSFIEYGLPVVSAIAGVYTIVASLPDVFGFTTRFLTTPWAGLVLAVLGALLGVSLSLLASRRRD